jgi:hypothetical protein
LTRAKSISITLLAFLLPALGFAQGAKTFPIPRTPAETETCFELGTAAIIHGNSSPNLDDLRKVLLSQPQVTRFIRENENYQPVSTQENQLFIDRTGAGSNTRHVFMNVELSPLKELNDNVFKEKSFPTAAANAYKKLFFRELAKVPELQRGAIKFSDYKTIRIEFADESPLTQQKATELAQKVALEYAEEVHSLGVAPLYAHAEGLVKDPSTWHLVGFGSSADEARVAAIVSADRNIGSRVLKPGVFAEFLPQLEKSLTQSRSQLKTLVEAPELKGRGEPNGLLSRTQKGQLIPSVEAIDLLRKTQPNTAENRLKFLKLANKAFSLRLDEPPQSLAKEANAPWVHAIFDVFNFAEAQFSPGIYSAEKVSLHGLDVPHGKIAIDFRGLGSRKVFTTMEAIADPASGGARQSLAAARRVLKEDQAYFANQKARMTEIAKQAFGSDVNVRFSGDECSIILAHPMNSREEALFNQRVQADPLTSRIRSVASSPIKTGVTRKDESIIIGEAESLEKDLRYQLLGQIDLKTLNRLHFALGISGQENRPVVLRYSIVGDLSDRDRALIQSTLRELVAAKGSMFTLDESPRAKSPAIQQTRTRNGAFSPAF